jgi:hypothetical protein
VDKTSTDAVVKFAYLQELLEPKIRKSVEALPFTSEGYNRAKSILQDRYGKQSEIIKAYTKQIFDLPKIPDGNAKQIHEIIICGAVFGNTWQTFSSQWVRIFIFYFNNFNLAHKKLKIYTT